MRAIKSITFFSLAFLLIGLFFELFLYLGGILDPIVTIDPKNGEHYVKNKISCSIFISEGFGIAQTNSRGWFGKEFKDDSPDNISVGVIGSSWVASRQVFYRDNFLSVAEKNANKKFHDKTVSFYNFGKESMLLTEMLHVKEEVASTYNPDILLVFLNTGTLKDHSNRYVSFYKLDNNKLILDTGFRQQPFVKNYFKFHALTSSSVVFLLNRVKNHIPDLNEIFFDKVYYALAKEEASEETVIDTIPEVDKRIIKELAGDKKVIFLLNFDKPLANKIIPLIGNAPYIDLAPALLQMQQQGIDPYYWEITNKRGHWNRLGHKVVGNKIADYLTQQINTHKY